MSNRELPFVSVCIPVYNGENYLLDSIKSALKQNYSNFELLIVDNFSTDRTETIVSGLNDSRVRYVRNKKKKDLEGCLSIPGYMADIVRSSSCKVKYLDKNGESKKLHAKGLLARCIQHEIDHINGILFIDYLSKTKKDMILRKIKKQKKEKEQTT